MAFNGLAVVCLVASALLLLVAAQTSRAEVKQKLYLIAGHKVESEVSAAGQLRNFLSVSLGPHQRCQRYSILLNSYQRKKNTLTSFQIADIGMLNKEDAEKRFNSFDIETLRDLYINGIQKYLDVGQVDGAMVELYKCLSTGFRDAKARTFLNNGELKQIVEQYESIAEQPVSLLTERQVKHPKLKLEDLHPTVRASVAQWFPDDPKAIQTLFEHKVERATERPKPAPAAAAAAAEAHSKATAHAQAGVQAQAGAQAQGGAHAQAGALAQAGAPIEASTLAATTAAVEVDDDNALLGYAFGAIIETYESVPLETSLSERCRAYSQIVEAEQEDLLRANYVDELVNGVKENLGHQQAAEPFVPDETKRENFLFVLQTVDPLQGGHEAWTDMVDCVGQWETVDPEAAQFLHSPELAQTFKDMLVLTGEAAPAPADPETEAATVPAAASTPVVHNAPPAAPLVAPK